jgi:CDP-glucose 4,6-dehydratase
LLALETAKAKTVLGLAPRWPLDEAIKRTMTWYKCFYQGEPALNLCLNDIAVYEGFDEPL